MAAGSGCHIAFFVRGTGRLGNSIAGAGRYTDRKYNCRRCVMVLAGLIVILIVIALAVVTVRESNERKAETLRKDTETREKRNEKINADIDNELKAVEDIMRQFFHGYYRTSRMIADGMPIGSTSGTAAYNDMISLIDLMEKKNEAIVNEGGQSRESEIHKAKEDAEAFREITKLLLNKKYPQMFSADDYGSINEAYWNEAAKMDISAADQIIDSYSKWINDLDTDKFRNIIPSYVPMCVWRYAMETPFPADRFHKATGTFRYLDKRYFTDLSIAYYYAVYRLGGHEALTREIGTLLSYPERTTEELTAVASALKWMGAYDEEKMILFKLAGRSMPAKAQERLAEISGH